VKGPTEPRRPLLRGVAAPKRPAARIARNIDMRIVESIAETVVRWKSISEEVMEPR
jgi:hypothetical protein